MQTLSTFDLVIEPRTGWQPLDYRELWRFRELLGFLIWRDIKIRYRQTVLGGLWAVFQPLIAMVVFGGLFTRVAGVKGDGSPYLLFVFAGLIPWTFFANAIALASNSLIGSEQMIRKIYFPRMLLPIGATAALGLDMLVSLAFMAALMVYYRWPATPRLLLLPVLILGSVLCVSGLGLILSSLNVRYRDIKYIVPFFTQMAFFLTPVLYPMRSVPPGLQTVLSLNPMAGLVEGFRYCLLGRPISKSLVAASLASSTLLFICGLFYFRRVERDFADVI
jgi:lipopolysaccharide transport system permease protein